MLNRHGTDGVMSPNKGNWWFIGAQSGAGLHDSQDGDNVSVANVAPQLVWPIHKGA